MHGRFAVYSGVGVQRIWVIGSHRMLALRDDDGDLPPLLRQYEQAGPFTGLDDALFGDFRVCALEPRRPGHMQHVRVAAIRRAMFRGKPFVGPSTPRS